MAFYRTILSGAGKRGRKLRQRAVIRSNGAWLLFSKKYAKEKKNRSASLRPVLFPDFVDWYEYFEMAVQVDEFRRQQAAEFAVNVELDFVPGSDFYAAGLGVDHFRVVDVFAFQRQCGKADEVGEIRLLQKDRKSTRLNSSHTS